MLNPLIITLPCLICDGASSSRTLLISLRIVFIFENSLLNSFKAFCDDCIKIFLILGICLRLKRRPFISLGETLLLFILPSIRSISETSFNEDLSSSKALESSLKDSTISKRLFNLILFVSGRFNHCFNILPPLAEIVLSKISMRVP